MTVRLIKRIENNLVEVRVVWCNIWDEYQCRAHTKSGGLPLRKPYATYHTDNKEDAIGTAQKMLDKSVI